MIYEAVITSAVLFIFVFVVLKGINVNVNINVCQKIDAEDKAFLEDLYNKDGDPKEVSDEVTLDELMKSVNAFMVGDEVK